MSTCVNDHLFLSVAVYRDARHLFTKTFPQSSRFYQATLLKGKAATILPRQTSLRTPAPAHLPRGPHTLAPGEALPGPGRLQPATGTSVSNPTPAHPSTVWVTAVTSPRWLCACGLPPDCNPAETQVCVWLDHRLQVRLQCLL